jgi:ABC-type uncharacterized transport system substrate-binding protein
VGLIALAPSAGMSGEATQDKGEPTSAASLPAPARIAVVLSSKAEPYERARAALDERLTRLGHGVESCQLEQIAAGKAAPSPETDVFVAVGTPAACWLHKRVRPPAKLVYCMVAGPAAVGLTGKPPRDGVSTDVPIKAQFQLIAKALPHARLLGMLYRSKSAGSRKILEEAESSLPKGWRLKPVDMDRHRSIAEAIDALLAQDMDIVWTAADQAVYNVAVVRSLLLGAVRRKKPVFGFSIAFVRAGALIGIGIDPRAQGHQAAALADRVFREGPQHAAGPTETPSPKRKPLSPEFEIAVNMIVAKKLSIRLPEGFLKSATRVFGK